MTVSTTQGFFLRNLFLARTLQKISKKVTREQNNNKKIKIVKFKIKNKRRETTKFSPTDSMRELSFSEKH